MPYTVLDKCLSAKYRINLINQLYSMHAFIVVVVALSLRGQRVTHN